MLTLDQISQEARALTPLEKLRLVDELLSGLEPVDLESQKKWVEECDQRFEAYRRGEIEAKDWNEVRREFLG